ncbi:MAG: hypothetical protein J3R72DRAFT_524260 [Linnemannia gamsii]|nr:MAG: hypothetical protein J3R72DRAFT_524260 [Linnemannia gamsii]
MSQCLLKIAELRFLQQDEDEGRCDAVVTEVGRVVGFVKVRHTVVVDGTQAVNILLGLSVLGNHLVVRFLAVQILVLVLVLVVLEGYVPMLWFKSYGMRMDQVLARLQDKFQAGTCLEIAFPGIELVDDSSDSDPERESESEFELESESDPSLIVVAVVDPVLMLPRRTSGDKVLREVVEVHMGSSQGHSTSSELGLALGLPLVLASVSLLSSK